MARRLNFKNYNQQSLPLRIWDARRSPLWWELLSFDENDSSDIKENSEDVVRLEAFLVVKHSFIKKKKKKKKILSITVASHIMVINGKVTHQRLQVTEKLVGYNLDDLSWINTLLESNTYIVMGIAWLFQLLLAHNKE